MIGDCVKITIKVDKNCFKNIIQVNNNSLIPTFEKGLAILDGKLTKSSYMESTLLRTSIEVAGAIEGDKKKNSQGKISNCQAKLLVYSEINAMDG